MFEILLRHVAMKAFEYRKQLKQRLLQFMWQRKGNDEEMIRKYSKFPLHCENKAGRRPYG